MVRQHKTFKQRVAALRAFHAGLIADVHRQLRTLNELSVLIDRLRKPDLESRPTMDMIETSSAHVDEFGRLHKSSRDTHRDLKRTLVGLRVLCARGAKRG